MIRLLEKTPTIREDIGSAKAEKLHFEQKEFAN